MASRKTRSVPARSAPRKSAAHARPKASTAAKAIFKIRRLAMIKRRHQAWLHKRAEEARLADASDVETVDADALVDFD